MDKDLIILVRLKLSGKKLNKQQKEDFQVKLANEGVRNIKNLAKTEFGLSIQELKPFKAANKHELVDFLLEYKIIKEGKKAQPKNRQSRGRSSRSGKSSRSRSGKRSRSRSGKRSRTVISKPDKEGYTLEQLSDMKKVNLNKLAKDYGIKRATTILKVELINKILEITNPIEIKKILTIEEIKNTLFNKGIKKGLPKDKKYLEKILDYNECDKNNIDCGEGNVCDLDNEVCVPEDERKNEWSDEPKSFIYNGSEVVGSKKSIDNFMKMVENDKDDLDVLDIVENDDDDGLPFEQDIDVDKNQEISQDDLDLILESDDEEEVIISQKVPKKRTIKHAKRDDIVGLFEEIEEKKDDPIQKLSEINKKSLQCFGLLS